jgi:hypothetical protein
LYRYAEALEKMAGFRVKIGEAEYKLNSVYPQLESARFHPLSLWK